MRIGLTVNDPRTVVADAQEAEELGFDFLGCGEHLFFHGPTPNAFTMLAAAAAATIRIRLVTSVASLPLYPAAMVAKLAATIDHISGGRFELGVAAGGEYPPEFEAAGVDPALRFRRVDEGLEVIRRLFGGGPVTFRGEFAALDGVALDPPPLQPGGPPIWLGGRRPGALRRAGRHADVWMPYMVDPQQVRTGLDQVRSAAVEHGRADAAVSAALFAWAAVDPEGDWARKTGIATVSAAYAQDFTGLADRYLLVGAPEQVVARLSEFASVGVETVLVQVASENAECRRRIVRTLAKEVLPAVSALEPGAQGP
ncbi:LLM class flavin-dependent oxidoreductase [Streptomyces hirsutus]|uniref:LLM class flavin-dependent oxidoreductase n=1 Tax=Streptomyces hirsutus TaxID=35620 RepID=UPI0036823EAD